MKSLTLVASDCEKQIHSVVAVKHPYPGALGAQWIPKAVLNIPSYGVRYRIIVLAVEKKASPGSKYSLSTCHVECFLFSNFRSSSLLSFGYSIFHSLIPVYHSQNTRVKANQSTRWPRTTTCHITQKKTTTSRSVVTSRELRLLQDHLPDQCPEWPMEMTSQDLPPFRGQTLSG